MVLNFSKNDPTTRRALKNKLFSNRNSVFLGLKITQPVAM